MNPQNTADIKENDLLKIDRSLLEILLQDKTTGKNIIWATDNYARHGSAYVADKPITVDLITSRNGSIIKPRTQKSKQEQQQRVRQKAEVFTPSWVCNMQNNLADETWFGCKDVFNREKEKSWETTGWKINFPEENGKTWQDYVSSSRIEITCGEAPYLTSRYDAVTGEYIEVPDRIGLLDRKLRVVGENTETREDWLKWATVAAQNIYGFEWQGDNLLIARENVLFTIAEHYEAKFAEKLGTQDLIGFAKIIAWNLWQMDGLKFVVPASCCTETKTEETLFETLVVSKECEGCKKGDYKKHNGIYCIIKDWETHKNIRFVDMVGGK
ncbi:MAG: restriction endonuclease subunit M [Treponema sp.]|nr:restriction endonuclease subunit M [Treponema sp.]